MTAFNPSPAPPSAALIPGPAPRSAAPPDPVWARFRPGHARLGLTATLLGGAGALVMLGALLLGDILWAAQEHFSSEPFTSSVVLAVPLTALVLFGALAFYGLRLEGFRKTPRPRDVPGDLRMTRVLAGALLVIGLVFLGAGQVGTSPLIVWPVMLAAALWSAACCWLLPEVRRAEWALAAARGVPFTDAPGHGFQVLVPAEAPAGALPGVAATNEGQHARPASAPPPLTAGGQAPGGALRHWEALLLVLVLLGVAVYLLQAATFVTRLDRYLHPGFWVDVLKGRTNAASLSGLVEMIPFLMFNGGASRPAAGIVVITTALSGGCALAWVAWGVGCAIAGPRLRRSALVVAAVTLGLVIFTTGHNLYWIHSVRTERGAGRGAYSGWQPGTAFKGPKPFVASTADSRGGFSTFQIALVRNGLMQAAFPLLLLVLLTRPQVAALFDVWPRRPRVASRRV